MKWRVEFSLLLGLLIAVKASDINFSPTQFAACGNGIGDFFYQNAVFTDDCPNALRVCSGFPQQIYNAAGNRASFCAVGTQVAAERACWQAGVNFDNARGIKIARCIPLQRPIEEDANVFYREIEGAPDINPPVGQAFQKEKWDCRAGGTYDCYDECYDNADSGVAVPGIVDLYGGVPPPPSITSGAGIVAAALDGDCEQGVFGSDIVDRSRVIFGVACFDINECNGVLYNCNGPFDTDCDLLAHPCAKQAHCTNREPGFSCECKPGYEALDGDEDNAYVVLNGLKDGCVDIDECTTLVNPCGVVNDRTLCQNTIGSYVCSCNDWKLFNLQPAATECAAVMCPAIEFDNGSNQPAETQNAQQEVQCEEGYVSSVNPDEDSFDITCRDERWCSCVEPSCQPKPCGDPGVDPYAFSDPTLGVQGNEVEYRCAPGFFTSTGGTSYTRTCNNGNWNNTSEFCGRRNLCVPDSPCDDNADCYPTVGSVVCICRWGYTGNGFRCTSIRCTNRPPFDNSDIKGVTGNTFGTEITIKCKDGYAICPWPSCDKHFTIYCAKTGRWEPQPFQQCYAINCGDPGDVKNAIRSASRFKFSMTITYTCWPGFRSTGPDGGQKFTTTCGADGNWEKLYRCDDHDECQSGPCDSDSSGYGASGSSGYVKHMCINTPGSFRCVCHYGFNLGKDGRKCSADGSYLTHGDSTRAPCEWYTGLSLCRNGGTCELDHGGYPTCRCKPGFSGANCDRDDVSTFEAIAIAALVIAIVALICGCCIIFCFCCSGMNVTGGVHPHPPPSYDPYGPKVGHSLPYNPFRRW